MYFLLFNSFGEKFDSLAFSKNISHPNIRIFQKGDRMHAPKMFHKEPGISILLEDSADSDQATSTIINFTKTNHSWLKKLASHPVRSAFNIGITVGGDDFSPCLTLDAGFVIILSQLRIGININCYPSSD